MKGTFITLSIVSHGDALKISHLLESLKNCEPSVDRFQLILTDNLMDDLPEFKDTSWKDLTILRNHKQLGFAENHNKAFKMAKGEYFAILNPDLLFEQPVFEPLSLSIQKGAADLVAPIILDDNRIIQDSFRTLPTPFELIQRRLPGYKFNPIKPDEDGFIYPDWIAGMFLLMRSDLYRTLGGLDEKFHLYFEDVDFCTRARLAGKKILVDSRLNVFHHAQHASRKSITYFLLHLQSSWKFFLSPIYTRALRERQKKRLEDKRKIIKMP